MNTRDEQIAAIALSRVGFHYMADMLKLYKEAGSAKAIIDNHNDIRQIVPEANQRLQELLTNLPEALDRAAQEQEHNERFSINTLVYGSDEYPQRLLECPDAPLVLFYRGTDCLNSRHIVTVVGTRHSTSYGKDLTHRFVTELKALVHDVVIVSGLAYGIDISAHRAALECKASTLGILAHGLDIIYPAAHKKTAAEMLSCGGLLTEYSTQTRIDKLNFIRRNRIAAGTSDACVLVESASHGGGLITMRIATDYHRDTFAFPGAVGAQYSEGCNNLIAKNGAALIQSADDFVDYMGWRTEVTAAKARRDGIERDLFPQLSPDERIVVTLLKDHGDLTSNILSIRSNMPVSKLTPLLFTLEMKGLVRPMAGGTYHLIGF